MRFMDPTASTASAAKVKAQKDVIRHSGIGTKERPGLEITPVGSRAGRNLAVKSTVLGKAHTQNSPVINQTTGPVPSTTGKSPGTNPRLARTPLKPGILWAKTSGNTRTFKPSIPLITEIADSKFVALKKTQAITTHPNVKRIEQTRANGVAMKEDIEPWRLARVRHP